MKFSTREDIEAPADAVFDALSDFEAFERAAMRRGADVSRIDPVAPIGEGLSWNLRFPVRGKMRRMVCILRRYDRASAIGLHGESNGYLAQLDLTLLALSKGRTRLGVELEIRPRTLPARLMLQSVRLSKSSYSRRFEARVQKFAADLELQHLKPGAL
ncbi:MAG: SRPBCC family protein [Paracoccaceae bacterium]